VNRDPKVVFNGRKHLISVLRTVGNKPGREGDHADAWKEHLGSLELDAKAHDVIAAVRAVVDLDLEPHAAELSRAIGCHFSVLCRDFKAMADGCGQHLKRLIQGVGSLRGDHRAEAFASAAAADEVPPETYDYGGVLHVGLDGGGGAEYGYGVTEQLKELEDAAFAAKAAKWAAAEAAGPEDGASKWFEITSYADLEAVLNDAIRLKPKGLYRRVVMHDGIGCAAGRHLALRFSSSPFYF